jgi:hypothetical protein
MHFLHTDMVPLGSGARHRAFRPISVTESTEPLVRCEFPIQIAPESRGARWIHGAIRLRSGGLQPSILRSTISPLAVFVVVLSFTPRASVEFCSPSVFVAIPKSRSPDATLKRAATKDGAHSKRRISTGRIRAAARAGRSVAATQIATAAAAIQTASSPLEWNGT